MRRFAWISAIAVLSSTSALAQRDLSKVEVKLEKLGPGVAVIIGSGGNIGLSYGEDANVIIDDQFAPLTHKIVAAVATVDSDPVRFVINTHWHGDHTGGNENFGKRGAVIVAHSNVRRRLSTEQISMLFGEQRAAPPPKHALPVVTFADSVTLHFNGDDLEIVHVANAHTDGDSLVRWRKANVLHMGDTYFHKVSFPIIDLESGGSIDGLIAAGKRGLALSDESTRIIPGHGPIASRAELAAYVAMLEDIRAKVAAGINSKRTLAEIQASAPAAGYGMVDGYWSPRRFVEIVYRSLTGDRSGRVAR